MQKDYSIESSKTSRCPPDWIDLGHHGCYYAYTGKTMSYNDSQEFCNSLGGHLIEIYNKEIQKIVANLNISSYHRFWIGAKTMRNKNTGRIESWFWQSSKQPLNFTNWLIGEPNNAEGNEFCIEMDVSQNHRWVDTQCERSDRAKPFCQMYIRKFTHWQKSPNVLSFSQ